MKSLKYYFEAEKKKNPDLRSIPLLMSAVADRDFNKRIITKWFNKLVDENDYDKKDKKEILNELCKATQKHPEECLK